jgi:hypothetical protein
VVTYVRGACSRLYPISVATRAGIVYACAHFHFTAGLRSTTRWTPFFFRNTSITIETTCGRICPHNNGPIALYSAAWLGLRGFEQVSNTLPSPPCGVLAPLDFDEVLRDQICTFEGPGLREQDSGLWIED